MRGDVEFVDAEVVDDPFAPAKSAVPEKRAEASPPGNVQARSLRVRSRLGEALYEKIQKDLPEFYRVVRDAAFGEDEYLPRDALNRPAKSAGQYLATHRKMFIDLMKMANADVDVSSADYNGDLDVFKQQLEGLSTSELKRLVNIAPDDEDDE